MGYLESFKPTGGSGYRVILGQGGGDYPSIKRPITKKVVCLKRLSVAVLKKYIYNYLEEEVS